MPRQPRTYSEANLYHVIQRGTNRQDIFYDDTDRRFFLRLLKSSLAQTDSGILAWCLMGNHVHLLICADLNMLSELSRLLFSRYALWFNKRHERCGTLFQGRFTSIPIGSDEQLIATVRYIHQNPVKAGLSPSCDFHWSSFIEYKTQPWIVDTSLVMNMVGSMQEFDHLHSQPVASLEIAPDVKSSSNTREVMNLVTRLLGKYGVHAADDLSFEQKQQFYSALKDHGITVKQMELATGISKSSIYRALK